MPQRYRLHLGDGTILLVDHDSLNTWLVDPKAMVQLEGSKLWLPLREFLAAEREAAYRAVPRRTAKTREELPLVPPPPKKGEKAPAPPTPPQPEPTPPQPEPPPPPNLEPPPPPKLEPSTPPPPRAEPAPRAPATPPPPPRQEPVAWVPVTPPPPRREEPAPWVPPTPQPPRSLPLTPPPPRERPLPTFSEPASQIGRPAGIEPVAAPVAPPRKPASRPLAPRPDDSIQPIPLVPLEEADVFADEDDSRVAADTYGEDLPVIPLKPLPDEGRGRASTWPGNDEVRGVGQDQGFDDGFDDEPQVGAELRHADVVFLRVMAVFGGFLSRALDPLSRLERRQRARRAAARSASAGPRPAEAPPKYTVPPKAAAALQRLGEALAGVFAKIGALRKAKAADEPQTIGELLASATPGPAPRPKATLEPRTPAALPIAEEYLDLEELPAAAAPRPPAELPPAEKPRAVATPNAPEALPYRPAVPPPVSLRPPPAISELPVLRLREIPKAEQQEEDEGDLYDGDYQYPGEEGAVARFLRGFGMWTKRVVLLAVLVGGVGWAAFTWRTWFPRAGEVGKKALTTIDRQVRSIETEKEREQALRAGIEQMPQLDPETIRLLLSSSGALDVLALFQAANDATDRGGASLTREEGLELAALRDELLAKLQAKEREQIRDYERSRAFGLALPSEERSALALVARGARALTPERLARLQALLGKQIAAGIPQASPSASATP